MTIDLNDDDNNDVLKVFCHTKMSPQNKNITFIVKEFKGSNKKLMLVNNTTKRKKKDQIFVV